MLDLPTLLSVSPPWVRTAVTVLSLAWALATLVTNALRAVPAEHFVALERSLPRVGQALRALRKLGSDLWPFAAALGSALAGLPVRRDSALPSRPTPPSTIPPAGPQAGHVQAALLVVLLLVALGALSLRCHPQLPPVAGCTPGASRCHADRPEVCSGSQRWEPVGDDTCAAVGGVCVDDARGAHCARARDAGVADVIGGDL